MAIDKLMPITQTVEVPYKKETSTMSDKLISGEGVNPTGNIDPKVDKTELEKTVNALNDFLKPERRNIKFEFHEKLERYYVTVVNSETKELIREIPARKLLDMYAEMADFMGFLIDKKV
ncbi:flagellar protein FlaG [Oceanobacillus sp. Castelsardo]|uniref:flagellar protein FlaG n=1 Tax=Oceanobacillus sp. Castelsardo TaxID=1851204 RepID=UPI0009EE9030|nr:flagellar protein FlaG [Oceanobacillus sp. Castelsardo]